MDPPIEEIEFLASSKHRVRVLNALAEGGCDRADLQSVTGAHASTIGRVLGDFEERRWIDIFDDRVAICCHDVETRALRAWIDTDAPEAREWAWSVFERYRREARPVDEAALDTPVPEQFTVP